MVATIMEVYRHIRIWCHNAKGLLQGDVNYSAIKNISVAITSCNFCFLCSGLWHAKRRRRRRRGRDWLHTDEVPCRPVLLQATLWWSWHVVQESASTTPQDAHTSEHMYMHVLWGLLHGYKAVTITMIYQATQLFLSFVLASPLRERSTGVNLFNYDPLPC